MYKIQEPEIFGRLKGDDALPISYKSRTDKYVDEIVGDAFERAHTLIKSKADNPTMNEKNVVDMAKVAIDQNGTLKVELKCVKDVFLKNPGSVYCYA